MNRASAAANTDVEHELALRVVDAVRAVAGVELTVEQALVRPSSRDRPEDFQSNVAMRLAKQLKRPPAELAAAVAEALEVEDLAEPTVSHPGFVNFVVRREWLEGALEAVAADPRAGAAPAAQPERVVVDYSAPNVAKEMHVGHLRSTIIGDALARTLRFAGHEAIPQNHVGDWGTPFGMLIEHLRDEGWADGAEHAIGDLNAFYQDARVKFDGDPAFAERSRLRVVALQGGDEATLALWRSLVEESERHFREVYAKLNVLIEPEHTVGESFYDDRLEAVAAELEERGIAVVDDGALVVFVPGHQNPLIVRKRDGGYTYDTTDLAAIRYRLLDLRADALLYVVGTPQRQHFAMIFEAARIAGWLTDDARARHVAFGSVLGEDGKMLRTRAGGAVKLADLLDEAVERAGAVLAARGELEAAERERLAAAVGIGAVKYADLSVDREHDYRFSFDRMLSLEGNTSVYLQYANARIHSVLRRAGADVADGPVLVAEPAERALALRLLAFPRVVDGVLESLQPHRLCTYLYETAVAFSGFYEACPILGASPDVRDSRLRLARTTSRVLTLGLGLLGIEAPERL